MHTSLSQLALPQLAKLEQQRHMDNSTGAQLDLHEDPACILLRRYACAARGANALTSSPLAQLAFRNAGLFG